jgi:SPP1 family predicted phage head-tail adaptor
VSPTDIGHLRDQVHLQQPLEVDDGSGGVTTSWMSVASVWATITPRSQREASVAGHLDGIVTHRVRLRHREDLRGGWRIVKGTRILRVLVVSDPDGRRRFVECLCEEEGR